MLKLSKLNLNLKKNSKISLSDYCTCDNFSLLCVYESSSSSDTGTLYFIQQKLDDGSYKIKKLIWVTDSMIFAFSINPTCDWMVIAYRGGMICILPIGVVMGRPQKGSEFWKSNDVTYLPNQLKSNSFVTCMKWWTTYKGKNTCIMGKSDGELIILDLSNGTTLFLEKFAESVQSLDVLYTNDKTLSYCFITLASLSQWKLLLEEIHNKGDISESDFGLDYTDAHSSSIIYFKSLKKFKGKSKKNHSYLPSKLYQFSSSTYLKSQYYNGKYFLGAYDKKSGKYKLFDCENLDSALYEFQLSLSVIDICVTKDLLFLIVEFPEEMDKSDKKPSKFAGSKNLKMCVMYRQYAYSQIFEKRNSSGIKRTRKQNMLLKPSKETVMPPDLANSVLIEFDLPGLKSAIDILGIKNFPMYCNFNLFQKIITEGQSILSKKSWSSYMKPFQKNSSVSLNKQKMYSKWSLEEIKSLSPLFIISSSGISICYMSQCFEDNCIDYLLSYEMDEAERLGAGLKLDMNELYRYTAELLTSGAAHLNSKVTKSKNCVILEYFELASTPIKSVLDCLSNYWDLEKCLSYALSQVVNINKMSPPNRTFLSNALIHLFGQVLSDPFDSFQGGNKKRNKYSEKFRRFVISNCFFNDLKAAKIMFEFGLTEEAFFIAKEKGCVLDLFSFMIENNFNTGWLETVSNVHIKESYGIKDQDSVLGSTGLIDLEIVARNEPRLIKALAEFICTLFSRLKTSSTNIFSFQTTNHLCSIFNPRGIVMDILFRIYSSSNSTDISSLAARESDMLILFNQTLSMSKDSFDGASTFSGTMKICREIGPELLAFCLLMTSKDNQIQQNKDYTYFIQTYSIINAAENKDLSLIFDSNELDEEHQPDSDYSLPNVIIKNKKFKFKKNILSMFWINKAQRKLLYLRDELSISVSIFDIDLFDEHETNTFNEIQLNKSKKILEEMRKRTNIFLSDRNQNQRCKIKLLGFNKDKSNRVLLLPKSIESGTEIIRQICLGKQHVLILTEAGSLYVAGSNKHGQLGTDRAIDRQNSTKSRNQCLDIVNPILLNIELNSDETILSASTGDYHSGVLVVSEVNKIPIGHIFTWGWGVHGQLGHGDVDDQRFPKRLIWNFSSIRDNGGHPEEFPIQLSMGCNHSVVLTNKGGVYCFGNNCYGQLGIPGLQKSTIPIRVLNLPDNITHIDTKYFHTVCCTSSSEIFTWGINPSIWQNSLNQNKSHEMISKPERVDTDNLLNQEIITQTNRYAYNVGHVFLCPNFGAAPLSCGSSHTTIVTESKLVYCFGSNVWGQLGTGNRKENNKLIEVKIPAPINFISSDDGITIAMNVSEKSTKLFVWGRCSHPFIQEHLKNVMSDTVKPQLLVEYQHAVDQNLLWKNCLGIDTGLNGTSKIICKQQLMIIFLGFFKYIDRDKFLELFGGIKEYDLIADYFLISELIIQSLFWRFKSIIYRLSEINTNGCCDDVVYDDIGIILQFYVGLVNNDKYNHIKKSVLAMIIGLFKKHNLPWSIYEKVVHPLLITDCFTIASHFVKFSLDRVLSSEFIRDLLLYLCEDIYNCTINDNIDKIDITMKDIERFYELIKTGYVETIYDAVDDHKVVFFSGCGHASVLGKYRDQLLKQVVDKLRKKQLNLSSQMIQRLYNDSSIFPDCLECLLNTLKI